MMGLRSIQCAAVALMAALTIVGCGNSEVHRHRGECVYRCRTRQHG